MTHFFVLLYSAEATSGACNPAQSQRTADQSADQVNMFITFMLSARDSEHYSDSLKNTHI